MGHLKILMEKTNSSPIKNPGEIITELFQGKVPVDEVNVSKTSQNFTYKIDIQPPLFLKLSNPHRDAYNHFPEKEFGILTFLHKSGVNVPEPYYFFRVKANKTIYSGYLAEWIEGISLLHLILSTHEISNKILVKILTGIAKEIGALMGKIHNLGITHGDLALRNIMISWEKKVYLVDFDYSMPLPFASRNYDGDLLITDLERALYQKRGLEEKIVKKLTNLIISGYQEERRFLKRLEGRIKVIKAFILA